ncbi:MAG: flagellar basal body L-ring protein FlgH [Pyrinomonadaceae bacterium]|nr:flagellar basal body L-ring protein FlgH [Pyrinomonadaceae bacterium]
MYKKSFIALIVLALSAGFAFGQKNKRKKKKNSAPKLKVVEMENMPPIKSQNYIGQPSTENGSLYSDNAPNTNLLVDFKARSVGDLVFVDVVETSTATVSSGADRNRESGTAGGLSTLAGVLPFPGAADVSSVITGLGNREFSGSGSTKRNSNVTARITARVVEVLPNGDLRIQAMKQVKINKETELLAVTGIIRKKDISADNAIQTLLIGDLRVEFNGKGVASKDNAPGWLFRFFDLINPF